jgi:hypothetical protein
MCRPPLSLAPRPPARPRYVRGGTWPRLILRAISATCLCRPRPSSCCRPQPRRCLRSRASPRPPSASIRCLPARAVGLPGAGPAGALFNLDAHCSLQSRLAPTAHPRHRRPGASAFPHSRSAHERRKRRAPGLSLSSSERVGWCIREGDFLMTQLVVTEQPGSREINRDGPTGGC